MLNQSTLAQTDSTIHIAQGIDTSTLEIFSSKGEKEGRNSPYPDNNSNSVTLSRNPIVEPFGIRLDDLQSSTKSFKYESKIGRDEFVIDKSRTSIVQTDRIIYIAQGIDTSTPVSSKGEKEGRNSAYPDNNSNSVTLSMNPIVKPFGIFLDALQSSTKSFKYGSKIDGDGFVIDKNRTLILKPLEPPDRWIQKKSISFLYLLRTEDVEAGISSRSELFFKDILEKDSIRALQMINQVYNDNVGNPHIQIGILHLSSHIDYSTGSPNLQTIALAALSDKNDDVKDYAVQCFENWNHKDGLKMLKTIHSDTKWLQSYIDSVIESLSQIYPEVTMA